MGTQTSQHLGDGTQFMGGNGSKSCDLIRICWAKLATQTLQKEDVTDEGEDRVVTYKMTV